MESSASLARPFSGASSTGGRPRRLSAAGSLVSPRLPHHALWSNATAASRAVSGAEGTADFLFVSAGFDEHIACQVALDIADLRQREAEPSGVQFCCHVRPLDELPVARAATLQAMQIRRVQRHETDLAQRVALVAYAVTSEFFKNDFAMRHVTWVRAFDRPRIVFRCSGDDDVPDVDWKDIFGPDAYYIDISLGPGDDSYVPSLLDACHVMVQAAEDDETAAYEQPLTDLELHTDGEVLAHSVLQSKLLEAIPDVPIEDDGEEEEEEDADEKAAWSAANENAAWSAANENAAVSSADERERAAAEADQSASATPAPADSRRNLEQLWAMLSQTEASLVQELAQLRSQLALRQEECDALEDERRGRMHVQRDLEERAALFAKTRFAVDPATVAAKLETVRAGSGAELRFEYNALQDDCVAEYARGQALQAEWASVRATTEHARQLQVDEASRVAREYSLARLRVRQLRVDTQHAAAYAARVEYLENVIACEQFLSDGIASERSRTVVLDTEAVRRDNERLANEIKHGHGKPRARSASALAELGRERERTHELQRRIEAHFRKLHVAQHVRRLSSPSAPVLPGVVQ